MTGHTHPTAAVFASGVTSSPSFAVPALEYGKLEVKLWGIRTVRICLDGCTSVTSKPSCIASFTRQSLCHSDCFSFRRLLICSETLSNHWPRMKSRESFTTSAALLCYFPSVLFLLSVAEPKHELLPRFLGDYHWGQLPVLSLAWRAKTWRRALRVSPAQVHTG